MRHRTLLFSARLGDPCRRTARKVTPFSPAFSGLLHTQSLARLKREQRQPQMPDPGESSLQGRLIWKRADKPRGAILPGENLQSLKMLLPDLVQLFFDVDRNVHGSSPVLPHVVGSTIGV